MASLFRSTVQKRGNAEERPDNVKDPLKNQQRAETIIVIERLPAFRNADEKKSKKKGTDRVRLRE